MRPDPLSVCVGDERVTEREARRRAAEALAFVELHARADRPVSSLNLHQLRFLELAKALAGRPKLLLLDEVMAGLNEAELATSVDIVRNVRDTLGTTSMPIRKIGACAAARGYVMKSVRRPILCP